MADAECARERRDPKASASRSTTAIRVVALPVCGVSESSLFDADS
jgi:hypothetical protein